MVQREFWRNVNKIIQYEQHISFQRRQKESQQKRLQSLVSKQLKLSTKMADYLHKNNQKNQDGKLTDEENQKQRKKFDLFLKKRKFKKN